jgi:hypothetical protein
MRDTTTLWISCVLNFNATKGTKEHEGGALMLLIEFRAFLFDNPEGAESTQ